ncbi:hypothetical protein ACH4E8_15020 [Streptomyces sp. NPDC017979]|uniref:hypothetical protein n=1 Tax=Streptomyces sp. NPDC017979 TaxID=3365024 RepID=UPI003794FA75
MGRLFQLLSLPRMVRHLDATAVGLPVDDEIRFDALEPRVERACAMARQGSFGPAKELLVAARETADWWLRRQASRELGETALTSPAWLEEWHEESPGDPDLALVRAEFAVAQAWDVRTTARASQVALEQFKGFHALLQDALPVLERAVELNPEDPTPWAVVLQHDLGSGAPRELFEEHLREALDRDPHNWSAHAVAVQFLAAKWYGSHEEMFAFAERAAAQCPDDGPLRGLPVVALSELMLDDELPDEPGLRYGPIGQDRVDAAIAAALELSATRPQGEPRIALVRNHLAWALIRDERPAPEVLDVFRAVGTGATTYPWAYTGEGASIFFSYRLQARTRVAQATPFFRGTVPLPAGARDGAGSAGGPDAGDGPTSRQTAAGARRELALVPAPIAQVADAVSLTGVTYRMAPLVRAGCTLVEVAPSQESTGNTGKPSGLRRTLLGEGDLVRLAKTFSTAQPWPVLVVSRVDGAYGISLVRERKIVTVHFWRGAEGAPPHAEATETATALVAAFPEGDVKQVTAALRDPGDGRGPLDSALAALRLPGLPEGYGEGFEVLAEAPQVRLVEKRSLMSSLRAPDRRS